MLQIFELHRDNFLGEDCLLAERQKRRGWKADSYLGLSMSKSLRWNAWIVWAIARVMAYGGA